jgi:GntR family transcriptional regulator
MMSSLDRDVPTPLYYQLKQALLADIRERGLKSGDRLPSEAAIEQNYHVSRSTIRQALNELTVEGQVRRIHGKGTFVAERRIVHIPFLTSFTENMRAQGYTPTRRVESMNEIKAPPEIAESLELEDGTSCLYLRRTLLADGRPVGVAETWLPMDVLGNQVLDAKQLEAGSLYELLQRPPISLQLHHGHEVVRSRRADPLTATLLRLATGDPVLAVERMSRTPEERVVELTRMVFAADRYEYRVQTTRPGL